VTTLPVAAGTPLLTGSLTAGSLRRWQVGLLTLAGVLLTAALFALTELQGRAGFLVVVVPVCAALVTAASFAVEGRRKAVNRMTSLLVAGAFTAAVIPLVAVIGYTVQRGVKRLDGYFLTHSMAGVGPVDDSGGAYHAILGTVEQVAIASAIAVPLGLLAAIYVTEYGRGRLAATVRFFVDVMTGIPSIVAGLFVFAFWVLALGQGFSGFAAALALAILMLPTVVRASEEMIRLVPDSLREASYALGVPKWRTILSVVLPTASTGITTGVMLAVARVTGETAPLLLTAFGISSIQRSPFADKQSGLPLFVYQEAQAPQEVAITRAWAGALTLIILVMALNLLARLLTRRNTLIQR
jgi:phosphate transport system permease protein